VKLQGFLQISESLFFGLTVAFDPDALVDSATEALLTPN
jgi:hypothetical protein